VGWTPGSLSRYPFPSTFVGCHSDCSKSWGQRGKKSSAVFQYRLPCGPALNKPRLPSQDHTLWHYHSPVDVNVQCYQDKAQELAGANPCWPYSSGHFPRPPTPLSGTKISVTSLNCVRTQQWAVQLKAKVSITSQEKINRKAKDKELSPYLNFLH
jgi:hypothetical protein